MRPRIPQNRSGQRRPVRRPAEQKPRRLLLLLTLLLLTAAGGWLLHSGLPLCKEETERTEPSAAEAGQISPAQPPDERLPLRGTIYDRNLNELAVSYRLYSLFVQPLKLADRAEAAEQLAQILSTDSADILRRLQGEETTVELAKGLDARQAAAVSALRQSGIYCTSAEARHYPGHAAAGQLLGFTSEGTGLSGCEALYDPVLQPGGFRCAEAPELDCAGQETLGKGLADVVLSLDLDLQQQLEELLARHLQQQEAASGSIVVLYPESGQVLAMVRQPGLDPNYFWQADEQREEHPLFAAEFFPELVRPLLTEAAAISEAGLDGNLLPATVSAPAYGLGKEQLEQYWHEFGLDQPVPNLLSSSEQNAAAETDQAGRLSAVQIAAGAASLFNSGKRIAPWLLKAVYDHGQQRFFTRNPAANPASRILPPAVGINLRRKLLDAHPGEEGFLFVASSSVMTEKQGLNEHHLQELLLAAVPGDSPRLLLIMAIDYGRLEPSPPAAEQNGENLQDLGRKLLSLLAAKQEEPPLELPPAEKNEANLRRFLLSRQLKQPDGKEKQAALSASVMPSVIGMSLRKGIQQLNRHHLAVRIQGSGRIVAQKPAAGTPLTDLKLCELTLEPPFIKNENNATGTPAAKPAPRTERKNSARPAGRRDQQNHP